MKRNFRILKPIIVTIVLFIIVTLTDLLIEILGGDIGKFFQAIFGISKTTLVYILIGILGLSLLYAVYEAFKNTNEKEELKAITEDIEPDVRRFYESLKERYKKRYDSKLDGRFEITLEVSENWDGENTQQFTGEYEGKGQISEAFEYINSAFEKQGRLLIVGSPGVGKTVLLLKLALELLDKADIEKKEAFPVIFNLASWSDEYEKFDDWLISVLNSGEGLSKDFAAALLREERIVFLLDGLDELARHLDIADEESQAKAAKIRANCLNSLNNYLDRGKKAVICCRVRQFEQMHELTGKAAPVSAKVKINDLSEAEILNSLMKAQNHNEDRIAAGNLLTILNKDENNELLKVLSTPFYFTTALEVFDKQVFDEDFPKTKSDLEDYLRRKFIEKKLNITANPNKFDKEKTKKWLTFLAELINRKKLITFELADLQPSDLAGKRKFSVVFGLVFGLIFGLILGLVGGLVFGLFGGLVFGLFGGLFGGLLVGLVGYSEEIQTEDIVSLDFVKLSNWNFWKKILVVGLVGGLVGGLVLGLLFGLVLGLVGGLVFGLLFGFDEIKSIKGFSNLENPYQRITGGFLTNLYFSFLITLLIIMGKMILEFYLQIENNDLYKRLNSILIAFLFIPVTTLLLTPLFRHFMLRMCLYIEDKMPLKYATFLNYAAEARILEKDGGQWRFRHQNLQDYFANLDE